MKFSKCLNCGASLKLNRGLRIKYCEYCGEEYLFEEFLNGDKTNKNSEDKYLDFVEEKRNELKEKEKQINLEKLIDEKTKKDKKSLKFKKQILAESIKKYKDFKKGKTTADINEEKFENFLKEDFFWTQNPDINGLPDSLKKYFNDDDRE